MTDAVINFYVGNHGDRHKNSVQDYIDFLSHIFNRRGIHLSVSDTLRDSGTNIIVDGFDGEMINRRIAELAESRADVRFVYVLTEFIEKHFMVTSFNHFGGICESAALSVMNLYLRLTRRDFRRPSIRDYCVCLMLSPMAVVYAVRYCVVHAYRYVRYDRSLSTLFCLDFGVRYLFYMHTRYLGLEAMIDYADGVAFCHEGIRKGYDEFQRAARAHAVPLGVFYPEFSSGDIPVTLEGKRCHVEMTGRITAYRARFARKIDDAIAAVGLDHLFGTTKCYSFGSVSTVSPRERGAFSLHPPQSKRWPYTSPTRIYRALCVDKNMPVVVENRKQHPIDDLCLVYADRHTVSTMYEFYTSNAALSEFLKDRVGRYLRVAQEANDRFCTLLCNVTAGRATPGRSGAATT